MSDLTDDSPLRGLPIAVVDVEATGLGEDSRAVEIAVVHLNLGSGELPTVAFRERLNPHVPMEPGASRATGITDADLVDCPTFEDVHVRLHEALVGRVLCAYNVPADWTWLRRELDILGEFPEGATDCAFCGETDLVGSGHVEGQPCPDLPFLSHPEVWIDACVWAKVNDKFKPSKKLGAVCERRGIAVQAHGAAGDALATALVLEPLLRELAAPQSPTAVWPTLGKLLEDQRKEALASEADFINYVLNKHGAGNRPRPDCPWHDLLGVEPPFWPEPKPPIGKCLKCRQPAVYTINQAGDVRVHGPMGHPHKCKEKR